MSWFADLATVIGGIIGLMIALFGFLKFITEPRMRQIIDETIRPVVVRVEQIEADNAVCKNTCTARITAVEGAQKGIDSSIERIGSEIRDGMRDLAASIRELADKHALTAEEVAEIRGRLDTPPRAPRRRRKA